MLECEILLQVLQVVSVNFPPFLYLMYKHQPLVFFWTHFSVHEPTHYHHRLFIDTTFGSTTGITDRTEILIRMSLIGSEYCEWRVYVKHF